MSAINVADEMTISIPAAGKMAGLGRNASYAAARRGEIPVIILGGKKRVPAARWRRILSEGIDAPVAQATRSGNAR